MPSSESKIAIRNRLEARGGHCISRDQISNRLRKLHIFSLIKLTGLEGLVICRASHANFSQTMINTLIKI